MWAPLVLMRNTIATIIPITRKIYVIFIVVAILISHEH
jgi:hypothetical protein